MTINEINNAIVRFEFDESQFVYSEEYKSERFKAENQMAKQAFAQLTETLGKVAVQELCGVCQDNLNLTLVEKIELIKENVWKTAFSYSNGEEFLSKLFGNQQIEREDFTSHSLTLQSLLELIKWTGSKKNAMHYQIKFINLMKIAQALTGFSLEPEKEGASVEIKISDLSQELKEFLAKKKEITLSNLGLTVIPQEIFEYAKKLEIIHLENNYLSHLKGIEKANHLKEIDVSGNKFVQWPLELIKLPKLNFLNISYNRLDPSKSFVFKKMPNGQFTLDYDNQS